MFIDKSKVLELLLASLDEETARLRGEYEVARHTSIDAPGRMQSRYDTTGIEAAWVASGLAASLNEKVRALTVMTSFRLPEHCETVVLGAIVGLGTPPDKLRFIFFLLPAMGGTSVTLPSLQVPIRVVTPASPLGQRLLGNEVGDLIAVNGSEGELEILFVQ